MYVVTPLTTSGSPALACTMTGHDATSIISCTTGCKSAGPTEQLTPSASTPRALKAKAAHLGEAPMYVRPDAVNVIVANTGNVHESFTATTAATISSRSAMVSMMTRSAEAASAALGKQVVCLGKREVAHREQQLAQRADVGGDILGSGITCAFHGSVEHLVDRRGSFELSRIRAERVRRHYLASRFNVATVHAGHHVGLLKAQQVGQLARSQARTHQLSAHSAIEKGKCFTGKHLAQKFASHIILRFVFAETPRLLSQRYVLRLIG